MYRAGNKGERERARNMGERERKIVQEIIEREGKKYGRERER